MITVEIYAVQHARRFELETDENIRADELCGCIRTVLGETDAGTAHGDMLISCDHRGVIPFEAKLGDCGTVNASVLLYVGESNINVKEVDTGAAG